MNTLGKGLLAGFFSKTVGATKSYETMTFEELLTVV
jgi:hypothetical protein